MKEVKEMNMEELGAYICSALEKEGIDTVLSGGCCVEEWSKKEGKLKKFWMFRESKGEYCF